MRGDLLGTPFPHLQSPPPLHHHTHTDAKTPPAPPAPYPYPACTPCLRAVPAHLQIKQIGGRAGRAGGLYPIGEVTTLLNKDLAALKEAMPAVSPEITVRTAPPPGTPVAALCVRRMAG
jgi:hypothetical protein